MENVNVTIVPFHLGSQPQLYAVKGRERPPAAGPGSTGPGTRVLSDGWQTWQVRVGNGSVPPR